MNGRCYPDSDYEGEAMTQVWRRMRILHDRNVNWQCSGFFQDVVMRRESCADLVIRGGRRQLEDGKDIPKQYVCMFQYLVSCSQDPGLQL